MAKIQIYSFAANNKYHICSDFLLTIVIASAFVLEFGQQNPGVDAFVLLPLPLVRQVLINKWLQDSENRAIRNAPAVITEMNLVGNKVKDYITLKAQKA